MREIYYVMCRVGGPCGTERLGGLSHNGEEAMRMARTYAKDDGYFAYTTTLVPHRDTLPLRAN